MLCFVCLAKKNPDVKVSTLHPGSKDDTLLVDYIKNQVAISSSLSAQRLVYNDKNEEVIFYIKQCEDYEEDDHFSYYLVVKHSLDREDTLIYDFETFSAVEAFVIDYNKRICVWSGNSNPPKSDILNWDRTGSYELEGFTD